jgi:hypothetical protein
MPNSIWDEHELAGGPASDVGSSAQGQWGLCRLRDWPIDWLIAAISNQSSDWPSAALTVSSANTWLSVCQHYTVNQIIKWAMEISLFYLSICSLIATNIKAYEHDGC